jgi:hypothetical protein
MPLRALASLSWDGNRSGEAVTMATGSKSYAVRDAGTPSRLGKVHRVYPYDLRSLLEALDEARFRSFTGTPQVVTVVSGRQSQVIRRYEHGKQVWSLSRAEIRHERGNRPPG